MPFVSLPMPEAMPWVAAPVPAAAAPDLSAHLLPGLPPGPLPGDPEPFPPEQGGPGSPVLAPAVEIHQSWSPAVLGPDGLGLQFLFDPMAQ
jgi:hypothetical protein